MNPGLLLFLLILLAVAWPVVAEPDVTTAYDKEENTQPLGIIWELDYNSKFQLDVLYVSEDNFQFGKFNGLNEKGTYLVASWDVISRPSMAQSKETDYWTLSVDDLGLSTMDLEFGIGKQGNYGLNIDISTLTTIGNDTGATPFLGSEVLTLPASWVAAPITSGMTASDTFHQFKPELERNRLEISLNKNLGSLFSVDAGYVYEEKKGEKIRGAAFYIDAANPHSALLPEPVDYTTIEFDAALEYAGKNLQFGLNYHLSDFDNEANENGGLTWQNPYSGVFNPGVDYPNGFGTIGLSPDHQFQQVRARGTYRFTPRIRLQFDGSYGTTEYQDTLPTYTVNPALVVTHALPVSSLDDLNTSTFHIRLLTNPFNRASLNFEYQYSDRENTTESYQWLYVRGDSQDQPAADRAIFNNPQNITKEKYTSEFTWRMRNRTRLTLTYDFEEIDREQVSVDTTEEDQFSAELKFYPLDTLTFRFEAAIADREASTYKWAESFLNTYSSDLINITPADRRWSNHPQLRQYYLASRETNSAKINISYWPTKSMSFSLDGDYVEHDYDQTVLGLKSETQATVNLSGNYEPIQDVNLYGWANYGYYDTGQAGRSFRGGIDQPANQLVEPLAQGSDPSRDWDVDESTETYGFGAGGNWIIVQDKFDISADYVYMRNIIEYDIGTGGASDLSGVPLPDRDTMLHQFNLSANYHVGTNVSWQLNYQYYRTRPLHETADAGTGQAYLITDDWALAGVGTDTLDKVLSLGLRSPDEVVNVISLSVTYRY
jgi:MtrB/PioB family decaheme-associated outer membrane protein